MSAQGSAEPRNLVWGVNEFRARASYFIETRLHRDMSPRYPEIRVRLQTDHPLALVSAIRHALRRSGVAPTEVRRFSAEALAAGGSHPIEVCRAWATVEQEH